MRKYDNGALLAGAADVWLAPDEKGLPVAQWPIALAVPFASDWRELTLEEAQRIMTEGSPFVAVMPWEALKPSLRSLRVDGLHPSDPGYPLVETWSLHARPGFEALAQAFSPCLQTALAPEPALHLAAVGDVMLDRSLGERLRAGDLAYPFAAVQPLLTAPDLTIGNLESGLGMGGRPEDKGYVFRAPPEAASALAQAGFDLLTLANNHAMDYGVEGLLEALQWLHAAGLVTAGAGENAEAAHRPAMLEVQGLKLAFLAYVDVPVEVRGFDARRWQATAERPGVAWAEPARIQSDVQAASRQADAVIVLLHSGYEYVPQPSPPQQAVAQAALGAGAVLVIGHHAHVLQPVEFYGRRVIAFGLGNFAFEDAGPPMSAILNVWLDADGVREIGFTPIWIEADGRPRPVTPEEARDIHSRLQELAHEPQP